MKNYDFQRGFNEKQISHMHQAADIAEELVSNNYQLSSRQWQKTPYEIKTLVELEHNEIVDIPYAQLVRYQARKKRSELSSACYDYYKICVQDHNILSAYKNNQGINLFSFFLYIITHELIHIVRFSRYLHLFHATEHERFIEEKKVHRKTKEILRCLHMASLKPVLEFKGWQMN
jgi:hypothetical protein